MSESSVAPAASQQTTNVPRDLLARLYREIGISAVAAALQVDRGEQIEAAKAPTAALAKASRLAA